MTRARNLRTEQAERTRAALIDVARDLFATKGYFATGTHEVVDRAQVTRGALYHHFPQKEDLFRAVFHAVQSDLLDRSAIEGEGLGEGDGPGGGRRWQALRENLQRFLHAATRPEVQRILLQDGPAVLGWNEWRTLEAHYGLGVINKALEDGMAAGQVRRQPIEPLSLLILAVVNEASLYIANAADPALAIATTTMALNTLLANLA
jgi:AcrR family transcriptional regulator